MSEPAVDDIGAVERWGALASSAAHLVAALPIVALSADGFARRLAAGFAHAHIALPWLSQWMVDCGDGPIAAVGAAIAVVGFASAWFGPRAARMALPPSLLAVQCWWTVAVLIAYLLPSAKLVLLIGEPT